jgi:hypothetical protein
LDGIELSDGSPTELTYVAWAVITHVQIPFLVDVGNRRFGGADIA